MGLTEDYKGARKALWVMDVFIAPIRHGFHTLSLIKLDISNMPRFLCQLYNIVVFLITLTPVT